MSQYYQRNADHQRQQPDPGTAPASSDAAEVTTEVAGPAIVYAGFWRRVAAYCADGLIISLLGWGLISIGIFAEGALAGEISSSIQFAVNVLLPLVLTALYFSLFHASKWQATPGKRAVGIKVVRPHGERLTRSRAFARFCGALVSGVSLNIGYLMAAFTQRKQALHDVICDTLVVDQWAFTDQPQLQKPGLGIVAWIILVVSFVLIAAYIVMMVMIFMLFMTLGNVLESSMSAFFDWLSRPRNY